MAEAALAETVIEHLDVEGILGFAETVLTDESRMWEHAKPEHKRRLQRALLPEGVVFEHAGAGRPEGLRTPATCRAFFGLGDFADPGSAMVALRGFEPRSDG